MTRVLLRTRVVIYNSLDIMVLVYFGYFYIVKTSKTGTIVILLGDFYK